ncbi:MAG: WbqC family protein [Kiritimatiellia bacterium]
MRCAIHQPQFLPWLGYLNKIHSADIFVFLDDVQFKKNEFQNRNRIRVGGEAKWITVPVSYDFGNSIRETRIASGPDWRRKMKLTLRQNYSKAPFFKDFAPALFELLDRKWKNLAELNIASVKWLTECFEIRTRTLISSDLTKDISSDGTTATDRLIQICAQVGADTYISGAGGRGYLEEEKFETAGLALEYQDFLHPEYPQCYTYGNGFLSYLSAVDGLFNCGGGAEGRKRLNL